MNQPVDDPSNSRNELSNADERRLKVFLRDAEAIIAAERGLNSASRTKLESLAKYQQLPDFLWSQALKQLQDPASFESNLSRYEQAFANFLDAEFKKLRGGVLSIRAEQKAFELAMTKYQIPVSRAEQIIGARAKLAAIARIAHSDATDYAERFVREQINQQLVLDDSLRDSIQERGEKLGLTTDQIDTLILRLLNENRQRKSQSRRRFVVQSSVIGLLLLGGVVVYSWGWFRQVETPRRQPAMLEPKLPTAIESPTAAAKWRSAETIGLIEQVERELQPPHKLKFRLLDESARVRAEGYRELATAAVQQQFSDPQRIETLLGNLFFEDLEEDAVTELVEPLLEVVRLASIEPAMAVKRFEQQLLANKLLATIYLSVHETPVDAALVAVRKQSLAERIHRRTGVSPQGLSIAEYLQRSEQTLAAEQWNYLIQNSWSQPAQVTALVEPLTNLTRSRLTLDVRSRLQSRLLQLLMEVKPDQWINLQPVLTEIVMAADEFELIEWIDLVRNSTHAKFQEFVGQLLLKRIGVSPASLRQADLVAALDRYSQDYGNQQLQPLLQRNERVENRTKQFLETLANLEQPVAPDQLAQLAVLVNIQLAVCQQLQKSDLLDHRGLGVIDSLLEKPKIRLREIVALPGKTANRGPTPPIPTASDINRKNLALERIANFADDQRGSRIRSLEDLEAIADRFGDLTYAESLLLAAYFLKPPTIDDELNIQRRISSFSHWPTLGLAIGDYVAQDTLAIDKALAMTRLFFRLEFDVESGDDNWSASIQNQVIKSTIADLENRVSDDPTNRQSDWVRLESYLSELYSQRGQFLAGSSGQLNSPPTSDPAEVLLTWIEIWLKNWDGPISESNQFARVKVFIGEGDYNGMQKTVMANRLLFELLRDEMPPARAAEEGELPLLVQRIQDKCKTRILGDQLFFVELDLLTQVSRRRESLLTYRMRRR